MKIMIVEDEALVALEISSYLEAAQHDVVGIADDLASALAVASDDPPDIALVDIKLAHGDSGLHVAAALKQLGIATFFATGNCPDESGRGLAIGCIHKPYSARTLEAALAAAGARLAGTPPPQLPTAVHLY